MKRISPKLALAFVCIILGFMISIQFKSVKDNMGIEIGQYKRAEQLQMELTQLGEKYNNLYQQLLENEKELNAFRQSSSDNNNHYKETLKQLNKAQILAGLTDVEGKGIIVTLDTSNSANTDDFNLSNSTFAIHDEDIWMIVNELVASGAEAISINNERLITTSEIRTTGSIISINNKRFREPFTIAAIGDAATLEASLNLRGGVKDILIAYGLELNIKKSDKVFIPRYDGIVNFRYALPVEKN